MSKSNAPRSPEPAERFTAYHVKTFEKKDGSEGKQWTPIGVAFPHKDGKGFNITLDATPLDGKIVLREYEPKENEQG